MKEWFIYKIDFDPPPENRRLHHLDLLSFNGFKLISAELISIPKFTVTKTKASVSVILSFLEKHLLSESDLKALDHFNQFFLHEILKDTSVPKDVFIFPSFSVEDDSFLHLEYTARLIERIDAKVVLDELLKECGVKTTQSILKGRVVSVKYPTPRKSFIIRNVHMDMTPLSPFPGENVEYATFCDYYLQKRDIVIQDRSQPLFSHGYVTTLHTSNTTYLIPELCWLTGLTSEMIQCGNLLPWMWKQYHSYLSFDVFERNNQLNWHNKRLLKVAFTHPSYSNEHEGPFSSYQRLEFVGDSVLNFLVTSALYYSLPDLSEGRLSFLKSSIITNSFISQLSRNLNLQSCILLGDSQCLSDKILADVFEALLGALFLDKGIEYTRDFFAYSMFKSDPLFSFTWIKHEEHNLCVDAMSDDFLEKLREIEEITQITFQSKSLLAAAFTHPSFYPRESQSNLHYQRLELLGDSILQLIVSVYLFEEFPTATEGDMSLYRSKLVSNQHLSEVVQDLALDQFLRHGSPFFTFTGPKRSKACADLFESFLGAVYLEHGLEQCCDLVERFLLLPNIIQPSQIIMDPKSLYQQLVQTKHDPLPIYKVTLETSTPFGSVYESGVFVNEILVAKGEGTTQKESETVAALAAIELYLLEDHFHSLDNDQRILPISQ